MSGYRIIERAVPLDLLHAVYRAEGWRRAEGESMTKRVKTLYDITADARRNRYVATRKCCAKALPVTSREMDRD